jgi:hypothetical protein
MPSAPMPDAAMAGADWAKGVAAWWAWSGIPWAQQAFDYALDAWQRSILFLDIMRQRGNDHFAHIAERAPNVLHFKFAVVVDGRALARPVNYALLEILPPPDVTIDAKKRPFIVFDPRAGHGPGIGGMKHDSEIGVALAAGHPCYYVGFLPEPVAGQTIEDVCRAEAHFVATVAERHKEAEGKPCLIGNCQAGWQIMMMSAVRPDLPGPIMLAGSPLSYWAGIHGKNPMRYLGGMLGGTWLTSLSGDLGGGIFDGANLVSNFESLDPANTYWKKSYNVYAKADTEGPRFLEFERWWGSPVLLNAEEMQFIADELFVGNKLASGELYTSDGVRIDLRNIRSPIIVFCSHADNITPPQQALGWVLDLYASDDEIVANGQTIIYALHQTVGHLGIFVSAKVATKEHQEFTEAMDLIDVLPPGLYEAVLTAKDPETTHPELIAGNYLVRFETRTLGDLRALGGNDAEDDRRFATVARVSEINQGSYRTYVSPLLRALVSKPGAEWLRSVHPLRLRFEMLSDKNPFLRPLADLAEAVRAQRRPVASDNPFLAAEREVSRHIGDALEAYGDRRDRLVESVFLSVYGAPGLQAMVGLRADANAGRQRVGSDVARETVVARRRAQLEAEVEQGGLREAAIRALLYIGLGREQPEADERSFAMLREIRDHNPESRRMRLPEFKELARRQYFLLRLDEGRAVAAIAAMLPEDAGERAAALDNIRRVVAARGAPTGEAKERLARIEAIFAAGPPAAATAGSGQNWEVAPTRRRQRGKAGEATGRAREPATRE